MKSVRGASILFGILAMAFAGMAQQNAPVPPPSKAKKPAPPVLEERVPAPPLMRVEPLPPAIDPEDQIFWRVPEPDDTFIEFPYMPRSRRAPAFSLFGTSPFARHRLSNSMFLAQTLASAAVGGELADGFGLGKWWKNSRLAQELKLTDVQITQLEKTFLEKRLALIDLRADVERHEARLDALLSDDRPEEAAVSQQLDLLLAARGKLEKEHAMMNLAFRRVLSVEQWKKLQALDGHYHWDGEDVLRMDLENLYKRRQYAPAPPARAPYPPSQATPAPLPRKKPASL